MAAKNFPDLSTLFNNSWVNFKKSLLPLFLFTLIYIGITVLFVLVMVILLGVSGIGIGTLLSGKNMDLQTIIPLIAGGGAVLLLFISAMIVLGTVFQVGNMLIVAEQNKKTPFGKIFNKSLAFITPVLLTGLLTSVITIGGIFFFILPAIILGFLFSFVNYEIVFNNQRYLAAVKRSATLVLSNFWEILGRVLLLLVIGLGLNIFPLFFRNENAAALAIFVSAVARALFSWFVMCYIYELYKEAVERTPQNATRSLWWVWLISVLGWTAALVVGYSVYSYVSSGGAQRLWQQIDKAAPLPLNTAFNSEEISAIKPKVVRSQELLKEIASLAAKDPAFGEQTRSRIIKLNNENIGELKAAVKIVPESELLWAMLCQSYQIPNTVGTEKEKTAACEKGKNYTPKKSS